MGQRHRKIVLEPPCVFLYLCICTHNTYFWLSLDRTFKRHKTRVLVRLLKLSLITPGFQVDASPVCSVRRDDVFWLPTPSWGEYTLDFVYPWWRVSCRGIFTNRCHLPSRYRCGVCPRFSLGWDRPTTYLGNSNSNPKTLMVLP